MRVANLSDRSYYGNMSDFLSSFPTQFAIVSIRYLVLAGIAYGVFWIWLPRRFAHRRIPNPAPLNIQGELKNSVLTMIIFALTGAGVVWCAKHGYGRIYLDVAERGVPYLLFSTVAAILMHDTYFYFTHRGMHHPKLFRWVHAVHHESRNPSPWAAYNFHPLEATVQAGILPLIIFTLPIHPIALGLFLMYVMVLNVLGHLGYEVFTRNWVHSPWTRWHNSATHHNQHHQTFRYNFSLYFNWWDKWLGTNHPKYAAYYDEVMSQAAQKRSDFSTYAQSAN